MIAYLRRMLLNQALRHRDLVEKFTPAWAALQMRDEETAPLAAAVYGNTMAATYGYCMAATMRLVEQECGPDLAFRVATLVDDILTNGDFEDRNADLESIR